MVSAKKQRNYNCEGPEEDALTKNTAIVLYFDMVLAAWPLLCVVQCPVVINEEYGLAEVNRFSEVCLSTKFKGRT